MLIHADVVISLDLFDSEAHFRFPDHLKNHTMGLNKALHAVQNVVYEVLKDDEYTDVNIKSKVVFKLPSQDEIVHTW